MADEAPEIIVHGLDHSRAQRLVFLLEECNLRYSAHTYQRGPDHAAPPEMKKVHPLGKSPILTIKQPGRTQPLVLSESGAIFEYIVEHFAPYLAPNREDETESWLRYRFYMYYSEGSLMSLLMRLHDLDGMKGDVSAIDSTLKRNLKTHLAFLESQIKSSPGGGPFLCGKDLTGADIIMSFPLQLIHQGMGGGLADYPVLDAYFERLSDRPAYKRSIGTA